jgi:hypothetical protein
MNESVFLQFKTAAGDWPLISASTDRGLRFQEPDPYDRAFGLVMGTDNPVTAIKMNDVRRKQGWGPTEFRFSGLVSVENGGLRLKGVAADAFPSGDYWFRLTLQDATITGNKLAFQVRRDAAAYLRVPVTPDPRQVAVALVGVDPAIQRLLDVPDSIDHGTLRAWLGSPARAMRKACALNILAVLRSFPAPADPFIGLVTDIFQIWPDRIYATVDPGLSDRLERLSSGDDRIVQREGAPFDAIHRRLLEYLPRAADRARASDYTLISYRADGLPSLQTVIAKPPDGSGLRSYADFDLDLGDSLEDLRGLAIHMGELASGRETDHLKLRDDLAGGGARPYLYYAVTNA